MSVDILHEIWRRAREQHQKYPETRSASYSLTLRYKLDHDGEWQSYKAYTKFVYVPCLSSLTGETLGHNTRIELRTYEDDDCLLSVVVPRSPSACYNIDSIKSTFLTELRCLVNMKKKIILRTHPLARHEIWLGHPGRISCATECSPVIAYGGVLNVSEEDMINNLAGKWFDTLLYV